MTSKIQDTFCALTYTLPVSYPSPSLQLLADVSDIFGEIVEKTNSSERTAIRNLIMHEPTQGKDFQKREQRKRNLDQINASWREEISAKLVKKSQTTSPEITVNNNESSSNSKLAGKKFVKFGTVTCPDGAVYEGDIKNDMRHGKGKVTFFDDTYYVGDFANNLFHGQGKQTFSNGDIYEGAFSNGKPHGRGVFQKAHGVNYAGEFENGIYISPKI